MTSSDQLWNSMSDCEYAFKLRQKSSNVDMELWISAIKAVRNEGLLGVNLMQSKS